MRRSDRQRSGAPSELAPSGPLPSAGEVRLRVRYCECDPMGVAHHSAYIPWFEIGRTELLRSAGVSYADMEAGGCFLVITRLEVRYQRPARYDNLVVISTLVERATRVRIDHSYELHLDQEDGRGKSALLAVAQSTLACVDEEGRPRVLPEWMRPE